MTIQECYQQLGGDFAQVEKRLSSVALIKRLIAMFPDDRCFFDLYAAMKEGHFERAFLAAHTLREVSANLGLNRLLFSVSQLTGSLHGRSKTIPPEACLLFEKTAKDYLLTICAIRAYIDSEAAYPLPGLRPRRLAV